LREFLRTEAASGILLVVAAVVALIWANSPWSWSYERVWTTSTSITIDHHTLHLLLREWVNEGLITIFFFVVGLEIRRELVGGRLAGRRAALLPVAAAIGGMAVPALIYLSIAGRSAPRGWAIVIATDIALAVGVLSMAGSRVSPSMRVFLLAVAVVDDVGALLIIAAAYSTDIALGWLAVAIAVFGIAWIARRAGVHGLWVYLALGGLLWLTLHAGGVSPTLAGVAMGLLAPFGVAASSRAVAVVERLEHFLHPWSSYVIVPLFALANTGLTFTTNLMHAAIRSPITWAIVVGRVVGKPVGIVLTTKSLVRARLADATGEPERKLIGVATSAGMGFTVALFIAGLAFSDPLRRSIATLAMLLAAVMAGGLSLAILRLGNDGIVDRADAPLGDAPQCSP
jgi:NhaA family Na+:H+ antiporter